MSDSALFGSDIGLIGPACYFLLTLAAWPPVSLTCEPDGAGATAAVLSFFGLRTSRLLRIWPLAMGFSSGAKMNVGAV